MRGGRPSTPRRNGVARTSAFRNGVAERGKSRNPEIENPKSRSLSRCDLAHVNVDLAVASAMHVGDLEWAHLVPPECRAFGWRGHAGRKIHDDAHGPRRLSAGTLRAQHG